MSRQVRTRYDIEISAEKTKQMTNSANRIHREIMVKGQKLGIVTSFRHLGIVVSDDCSQLEIIRRYTQARAALTKLMPIWRDNKLDRSKMTVMRFLVISVFLHAFESSTMTAELGKDEAFEIRCYRILYNFSPLISVKGSVGCFEFSGPLRQYFSLYRAISQREGKKQRKNRGE